MILLIDHNLHAVRQALIKLFDRDHFIDDHVRFIATAEIQTALQNNNRIGLDVVSMFDKILRPQNTTNRTVDVFEIEHCVLRRAVRIAWILDVRLLDRRNHPAHAHPVAVLAVLQTRSFMRTVGR